MADDGKVEILGQFFMTKLAHRIKAFHQKLYPSPSLLKEVKCEECRGEGEYEQLITEYTGVDCEMGGCPSSFTYNAVRECPKCKGEGGLMVLPFAIQRDKDAAEQKVAKIKDLVMNIYLAVIVVAGPGATLYLFCRFILKL